MKAISSASSLGGGYTVVSYRQPEDRPRCRPPEDDVSGTSSILRDVDLGWRACIDKLLQLRNIGDDWDGEGSPAPFPEIIDSAIDLLKSDDFKSQLPPPNRILPRRDGQVGLEWFIGDSYLSARIYDRGTARCMLRAPGEADRFFSWNWLSNAQEITWKR